MTYRFFPIGIRLILSCTLLFVAVGCVSEPRKSGHRADVVVATTTLLATIPESELQQESNTPGDSHRGRSTIVISDTGNGYAYVAQKSGSSYVVHNGRHLNPYQEIGHLKLSPDGQHVAYSYRIGKRCMVLDQHMGRFFDDVWEPVFSPDNRRIAYIAQENELSHIVIGDKMSAGTQTYTGFPLFSSDSSKVAYVEGAFQERAARLIVSDLNLKPLLTRDCTNTEFVANADKSRIAAVALFNGKQRVVVVDFAKPEQVKEGPLYDAIQKIVFGSDGISVAYAAMKGTARYLVYDGKEQRLPDDAEVESLVIHPDQKGVGIIFGSREQYSLLEAFKQSPAAEDKYSEATALVYSNDGSQHAYVAAQGKSVFIVVNGKEGPAYDMVVTPKFTPDGKQIIYRARKDGRRFVVVSDLNGRTIRQHSSYEQVFPPVFTADGKSVAYGAKDGNQLLWKVEKL